MLSTRENGPPQAARRRTSQTVAAMSSTDSASSQPPSIHWNGQNRLPGWYRVHCVYPCLSEVPQHGA